ncbi:uncharacterized protein LOC130792013 [Actinidia eriantha]|uniref:uncharacterized protein LOC130792013 n=1 Tax=Actinidia eriantha TaxID=165200 RepID=UPI00258DFB03|nr:uncharacterized protein LOC130792013 [Actinidia eriantha]
MDTDMEAVGEISKKRKLPHNDDDDDLPIEDHIDDEDEDEEKKMDMCFSIIRSYREARYHIMKGSSSSAKQEEEEEEMIINTGKKLKMNKLELEEKPPLPPPVSVWKPSFRPEDFAQEDAKLPCMTCHDPPHVASPPKAPTQHHPRQKQPSRFRASPASNFRDLS